MKSSNVSKKSLMAMIIFSLLSLYGMAQDKGLDIDIDIHKKAWYEQPWAWVIGAAVFILLLVAILRGGKKA
jgi:hypothetical protein